jgi:hypothetical protein
MERVEEYRNNPQYFDFDVLDVCVVQKLNSIVNLKVGGHAAAGKHLHLGVVLVLYRQKLEFMLVGS